MYFKEKNFNSRAIWGYGKYHECCMQNWNFGISWFDLTSQEKDMII